MPIQNPVNAIVDWHTERAIVQADSHGPEVGDLFELKGRMPRIGFKELVVLVRQAADVGR